jgi:acetolactate synthase-1/2/3 large subunit
VAGAILDVLGRHYGVRTAFGLPGVHNLAFWNALTDSDDGGTGRPRIVGVRHEQTTGYAADGLARATGGLGVALATTGPGAANAVTAFGEAAASGSPVLLVASEVAAAERRPGRLRGLLHETRDQAALFEPLAKAVYRPVTPVEAVEAVARAAAAALTFPRGPVYVGVPTDVLEAPAPEAWHASLPQPPAPAAPTSTGLDRTLALLASARRPLLWVGGGAVQSDAAEAVTDLAWRLGAPVITTFAARGLLAPGHPLLVDAPPHEPEVAALLAQADLLLVVGSAFEGMTTRNWAVPVPPRVVVVDVDAEAAGELAVDVRLVADAAATCRALAVRLRQREPWADSVFRIGPTLRARLAADARTSDAAALLSAVEDGWADAGPVVCDMSVGGYWVGGYAAVPRPRRLQYPVGWGTLGYGLPAAVGAACAGAGPVLAVCGDGGLAMGLGELATLVQERLPVTVLVVDDGGYGMLRYDQQVLGHPERGVDLLGPDWELLARAFGLPVTVAAGTGEPLRVALAAAAGSGGPGLVVVRAALTPPRTTSPRWHED